MFKCIIIDDDTFSREILKELITKHPDLDFINEFNNPVLALDYLKKSKIDVIFLDIEMPEMTGLEFLETFDDQLPNIIITTSHENFAAKAFQYDVIGYLVKPINTTLFHKAINKIIKQAKIKTEFNISNNIFFIKNGSTIKKITTDEITLIECIGDYITIYTEKEKHTIHSTMKAIESKFDSNQFIRVHRSYIIKFSKIEEIEDDAISFGNKLVPIGKTYRQEVFSRLNML